MDDAGKAETLLRNLARRLEKDWEGVSASNPGRARRDAHRNKARTAAGTAAFARLHEHHRERHGHGAARLPEREYWRSPSMAFTLDWRAMQEAAKGFRRLKALQTASLLQAALAARKARAASFERASCQNRRRLRRFSISDARFALFNIKWDIA